MGRGVLVVGVVIVGYFALVIWPVLMEHSGEGLSLESKFPRVELESVGGQIVSMPSETAQVTVFNVWATWCAPCRRELPMLQALSEQWRSQNVEFVLGNEELTNKNNVIEYLQSRNIALPNYFLDAGDSRAIGGVPVVPMTFVLDQEGNLKKRFSGIVSYEELDMAITSLISDKTGLK